MVALQETFEKVLNENLYLEKINEDLLYEVYQSAIAALHKEEFKDFN